MDWMSLIGPCLLGLLAAVLLMLFPKKHKPPPPPAPPNRRRSSSHTPLLTNCVPFPPPQNTHRNTAIPPPRPRRSRERPPSASPHVQNTESLNPRDFPICPICAAGNDLGEGNVQRIGPRRYCCIAGHVF